MEIAMFTILLMLVGPYPGNALGAGESTNRREWVEIVSFPPSEARADLESLRLAVEQGHQPWRLDPQAVASVELGAWEKDGRLGKDAAAAFREANAWENWVIVPAAGDGVQAELTAGRYKAVVSLTRGKSSVKMWNVRWTHVFVDVSCGSSRGQPR